MLVPSEAGQAFRDCAMGLLVMAVDEIDDTRFWEITDVIGWRMGMTTAIAAERIAESIPLADCIGAGARAYVLEAALTNAIRSRTEHELSLSHASNLCAHIIGLGRAAYRAAILNPATIDPQIYQSGFNYTFNAAHQLYDLDVVEALVDRVAEPNHLELLRHPKYGLGFAVNDRRLVFRDGDLLMAK